MRLCDYSLQMARTCKGSKVAEYRMTIDDETVYLCPDCFAKLVRENEADLAERKITVTNLTTGYICDRIYINRDGVGKVHFLRED